MPTFARYTDRLAAPARKATSSPWAGCSIARSAAIAGASFIASGGGTGYAAARPGPAPSHRQPAPARESNGCPAGPGAARPRPGDPFSSPVFVMQPAPGPLAVPDAPAFRTSFKPAISKTRILRGDGPLHGCACPLAACWQACRRPQHSRTLPCKPSPSPPHRQRNPRGRKRQRGSAKSGQRALPAATAPSCYATCPASACRAWAASSPCPACMAWPTTACASRWTAWI